MECRCDRSNRVIDSMHSYNVGQKIPEDYTQALWDTFPRLLFGLLAAVMRRFDPVRAARILVPNTHPSTIPEVGPVDPEDRAFFRLSCYLLGPNQVKMFRICLLWFEGTKDSAVFSFIVQAATYPGAATALDKAILKFPDFPHRLFMAIGGNIYRYWSGDYAGREGPSKPNATSCCSWTSSSSAAWGDPDQRSSGVSTPLSSWRRQRNVCTYSTYTGCIAGQSDFKWRN